MDDIVWDFLEEPKLEDAILIEGLPGVGNVGKLAAEHLLDEIDGTKFAEIYSVYLPPQVLVGEDGVSQLVSNSLYYKKDVGEDKQDLIILTGDYQGMTPQGQYQLSDGILSKLKEFNGKMVFTLGGYGQGKMIEESRVLGAATSPELVEKMKEIGVTFSKEHPSSGIVGASGLLLGLGKRIYGIDGVCLMGETSGYFVDPSAARSVLQILTKYLKEEIKYDKLDDKAEEVEELASKVREMDISGGMQQESTKKDLNYIG